jgi:hypothetical protein
LRNLKYQLSKEIFVFIPGFKVNEFVRKPYPKDCDIVSHERKKKDSKAKTEEERKTKTQETSRKASKRRNQRKKHEEAQDKEEMLHWEEEVPRMEALLTILTTQNSSAQVIYITVEDKILELKGINLGSK